MSEEIKDEAVVEEEVKDESAEEVKEVDVPKYTDDDIDEIVNKKFAKWQEKKEEEINEAKKLADMNAQQKAEFERDKLEKELNELRRANTLNEMSGNVRAMLKESNVNIDDSLLKVLVADDAEQTKTNVDSFVSMFNSAVDKAVLERIKNPNEKRGVTSTITKEDIMKIKDSELRQQKIKENIHLFK